MSESFQSQPPQSGSAAKQPAGDPTDRRMVRADLLGDHSHQTTCGVQVHVWQRNGKYLARGRYQGKRYGEDLGSDSVQAAANLRRLMVDIENGCYVRPSEKRKRPLKCNTVPQLSVRELCSEFLTEKRRTVGKETSDTYRSRLVPVIEFSEQAESRRRWPRAMDLDREFAIALKVYLHERIATRNGRPSANEAPMSPRQMYNVMDCARSMFHWAKRPDVNKLPSPFVNPLSKEIVGNKLRQDPLRPIKLPLECRIELVHEMDLWQLIHLVIPFVLPLRPEDYVGLLISEVNFDHCLLTFATRLGGRDFNKGRQSFITPFPPEFVPLLRICIGHRVDGPLLRSRAVFEGRRRPLLSVDCSADIGLHLDRALIESPKDAIQTSQDQKLLFRRLLRKMGGVSEDGMAKEFKRLFVKLGIGTNIRFYDLRGSVNTEMDRAGVSHLVQRYVTGHTLGDILNEYVSLDPAAEMQKYFDFISPLLKAVAERSAQLGIVARYKVGKRFSP